MKEKMSKEEQKIPDEMVPKELTAEQEIANRLGEISQFLVPGTLLTLVARVPGKEEGDYILSNDDLEEAKKVLGRKLDKSIVGVDGGLL